MAIRGRGRVEKTEKVIKKSPALNAGLFSYMLGGGGASPGAGGVVGVSERGEGVSGAAFAVVGRAGCGAEMSATDLAHEALPALAIVQSEMAVSYDVAVVLLAAHIARRVRTGKIGSALLGHARLLENGCHLEILW